jgi:hypothetical protein
MIGCSKNSGRLLAKKVFDYAIDALGENTSDRLGCNRRRIDLHIGTLRAMS